VGLWSFGTEPAKTGEILLPGRGDVAPSSGWRRRCGSGGACIRRGPVPTSCSTGARAPSTRPRRSSLEAPAPGLRVDGVRLRTNRGLVALNDLDTGAVWDVDSDAPIKIDDWPSVIPPPKAGQ
jgi:hypothetical protein